MKARAIKWYHIDDNFMPVYVCGGDVFIPINSPIIYVNEQMILSLSLEPKDIDRVLNHYNKIKKSLNL